MDDDTRPPDDGSRNPGKKRGSEMSVWAMAGLGLVLTVVMLLATVAGKWVDAKFDSAPWGTLGIGLVALAAVLYHVLRDVNK